MAVRISDMERANSLADEDLFEICRQLEGKKSYSVDARSIGEYCKTLNNGGFKGIIETDDLNSLLNTSAGTYYWSGQNPPLSGMPSSGILEVITYVKPDTSTEQTTTASNQQGVIQRLQSGSQIYVRGYSKENGWSNWSPVTNVNGNRILSGVSSDSTINFNTEAHVTEGNFFSKIPVVVAVPTNTSANSVHLLNIGTVSQTGFEVYRWSSDTVATVDETTEKSTTTESGGTTTKTTETKTQSTRGLWTTGDFSYYWIATVDG